MVLTIDVTVITLSGMTLIMGLVVMLFIYQTFRKNRRNHVLTVGFISGWIALLALTLRETNAFSTVTIFNAVGGLAFSLLFFCIYLHYEFASRSTPYLWRFGFMCALLGMRVMTVTVHALMPENIYVSAMYYPSFDIIRMSAFLFSLYISWKTWQLTGEWESAVETLAIVMLVLGGVLGIIHRPIDIGFLPPTTEILGIPLDPTLLLSYLLTVIGIFTYLVVFIINPDYLFRLPIPLHHVIVYNETGMAFYSRAIKSKGISPIEITDQLFSGAITAISSLLSESAHQPVALQSISSSSQSILFEHHPTGISALLVCEDPSYYVKLSLRRFLQEIPNDLMNRMAETAMVNVAEIKKMLDDLVQHSFPYVEFQ